ncbi:MAG: DUF5693 family protein [Fimbriimonadales bacterium]
MSPRFRPPVWLWFALAVSTAVSLWVAVERHRGEAANRAVHLVVDMPDVRLLAASSGKPHAEVLAELRADGVTGVAVAEDTIDDLIASGQIEPSSPGRYRVADPSIADRLSDVMRRFGVATGAPTAVFELPDGETLGIWARLSDINTFGLGFDRETVSLVKDAGLSVVARVSNPPLSTKSSIAQVVEAVEAIGAEGVIFGGDQVLGRRDLIPYAAELFRNAGVWVGPVEFSNQGGLTHMLMETLDRTVRVHSMVAAEIDRNELPDIVDRYVRAVVERNIKVLFLRPFNRSSESPLASFREAVTKIRKGLENEGYQAKPARPEYPQDRPVWAAVVIGLGIAFAGGWLVGRFVGGYWPWLVGFLLAALAVAVVAGFGTKYVALVAAIIFPTWGMLAALSVGNEPGSTGKWVSAFFWVTAISVVGGLHIAALLTQLPYMLRLDQFFGVKLAHFLPPMVVAGYLLFEQVRFGEVLALRIRWFDLAMLGLVLVVILMMLGRTGNDAPGDVSALELKMRNFLDRALPERPRTKEFLIGHPAFIVGLAMAFRGDRKYLPLFGLLAAVGQASVLNTFCHLHAPIEVSILRVVTGLVVGGVIGLCALFVYNRIRAA